MPKICAICGELRKITMKCSRCNRTVCLNDIFVKTGLCNDCLCEEIKTEYNDYSEVVLNAV